MAKINKKIGFGSISLLLCVIGLLFIVLIKYQIGYAENLLKSIGLSTWSNADSGIHYTVFYPIIFFIPAFIVGNKFKNDLGATLGKIVSLIIIILSLILFPLMYFYYTLT
ncbi:hypothetical protein [Clostridium sp.]